MRKAFFLVLVAIIAGMALERTETQAQAQKTLDIYFVDVEGGQATLFVSPSGEALLVDAGHPGARDAARIAAVAKQAGLRHIDYFVNTHHHGDHVGGAADLIAHLPVRNFVDHGVTPENGAEGRAYGGYAAYLKERAKGRHIPVKPGDKVPITGVDVQIASAGGDVLTSSLPGAGAPNPLCRDFTPRGYPESLKFAEPEDSRSVGMVIGYGRFRMLDLGDLVWNVEHGLACPNHLLGTVDVYLASSHGQNLAGQPALVHPLRPRVAVMNNSPTKGNVAEVSRTLKNSPALEDIWQLHYSAPRPANREMFETMEQGGPGRNAPEQLIANLDETPTHTSVYAIKISARQDGSFVVTNLRNGYRKEYSAHKK